VIVLALPDLVRYSVRERRTDRTALGVVRQQLAVPTEKNALRDRISMAAPETGCALSPSETAGRALIVQFRKGNVAWRWPSARRTTVEHYCPDGQDPGKDEILARAMNRVRLPGSCGEQPRFGRRDGNAGQVTGRSWGNGARRQCCPGGPNREMSTSVSPVTTQRRRQC